MKYILLLILGFFSVILRDTIFNDLSVAGGKPDFMLIMVVFFAIFNGPLKGGCLGLAMGFLEDLLAGRFIGVNALCKGIIGWIIGHSERRLYKNNFFVPIVCLIVGTIANAFIYYVLSKLIGSNIVFIGMVITTIPDIVYNSCFAPLIYAAFYQISAKDIRD